MVSRAQRLGLSDSDTQVSASRQRAAGVQGGGEGQRDAQVN